MRAQHDVIISSDEFKKLVELVDRNSTGEFTAEMFHRAFPGPFAEPRACLVLCRSSKCLTLLALWAGFMEQTDAELEKIEKETEAQHETIRAASSPSGEVKFENPLDAELMDPTADLESG